MTLLTRCIAGAFLAFAAVSPGGAQADVDAALQFFRNGGAYCFRLAPEGTSLSDETAWTVLVLTGATNHKNEFRIRSMDPGTTGVSGRALQTVGLTVTSLWRRDTLRDEFFERFAMEMAGGLTRARLVNLAPAPLATMKERERADLYLKFADKGTKVDFSRVPDLTPEDFLSYRTFVPD